MKMRYTIILATILILLPVASFAARTQSSWFVSNDGTYIQPQSTLNVLINGVNRYLNFGTFSGSSGYGLRDNGGTMEFKNNAGSWTGISATTAGGSDTQVEYNNNGSFAGNEGFTFSSSTATLTLLQKQSDFTAVNVTSIGPTYGAPPANGDYFANGSSFEAVILPYKIFNGIKYFGTTWGDSVIPTDNSARNLSVSWTWASVSGADGYRIFFSDPYYMHSAFDSTARYYDTSSTTIALGRISPNIEDSTTACDYTLCSSSNPLPFQGSGKIGIGTTTPLARLSIQSPSSSGIPYLVIASSTANATAQIFAIASSTGNVEIAAKVSTYNGTTTAGAGVVPVVLSQNVTAQTAAFNFTPYQPTATTTIQINGYVVITAVTLDVVQPQCAFTDETGTSRTMAFSLQSVAAGIAANAGTTGYFSIVPGVIRVKANTQVSCTIALTTGTGSITYDAGGQLLALDPVR